MKAKFLIEKLRCFVHAKEVSGISGGFKLVSTANLFRETTLGTEEQFYHVQDTAEKLRYIVYAEELLGFSRGSERMGIANLIRETTLVTLAFLFCSSLSNSQRWDTIEK